MSVCKSLLTLSVEYRIMKYLSTIYSAIRGTDAHFHAAHQVYAKEQQVNARYRWLASSGDIMECCMY